MVALDMDDGELRDNEMDDSEWNEESIEAEGVQ
jgi:hypothetical protein